LIFYFNKYFIKLIILIIFKFIFFVLQINKNEWGLGIGDWGLGIADSAQSPIPNPQSPIPNPQSPISIIIKNIINNYF